MRKLIFILLATAVFAAIPLTPMLGPVVGSLGLLALGIALALGASGSLSALGAAGGALGTLLSVVLLPLSPAASGAVLVGFAYGERTSRVRGAKERLLHIGIALVGGALAGTLAVSYASHSLSVRGVAALVAAVLALLPSFVDADDVVAHRLDGFADEVSGPAAATLREGAALRRAADATLIDRATKRQVKKTWATFLKLAEVRARLEQSVIARKPANGELPAKAAAVVKRIEDRLAEHVTVLTRAYAAIDTAKAAEASLDDAALRIVETAGESYETLGTVMVDEVEKTSEKAEIAAAEIA